MLRTVAQTLYRALRDNVPGGHCSRMRWAHLSLACVGLMFTLPFLYYLHQFPLSTFYQEWGAALLGLVGSTLLLSRTYWVAPEIPRIVLLPIGLALLVLVQYALGKLPYFEQVLLFTLYMFWAALLLMLGQRLRAQLGLAALATALAGFLLLGAELSAFAGIVQHFSWHTFVDGLIAARPGASIVGNMGQPNHFADYTTLGLVSLGLLWVRGNLRNWHTLLLALPLLFVLVLAGSRSAWLYLSCLSLLAYVLQRRDHACLPLLRYASLLLLGFALMHWVVQWMPGVPGQVTSIERLAAQVSGGSIRLSIWHEAWLIFTRFPWLGAGFGQFGWQHFLLGPSLHNPTISGLYNNAHNLPLQVAAEMGVAGLLVLCATLGLWLRQSWGPLCDTMVAADEPSAAQGIYYWWGYGLLMVLGIHSLLEYPLWYAYFLGLAAILLGILDNTTFRLELRGTGRAAVALMLLLGVMSLSQVWQGYRKLEGLMAMQPSSATDSGYSARVGTGLMEVHRQSLLRPYTEIFISSMIEPSLGNLADKRALNESVMRLVPISTVVYREATLLALAGEQAAAQAQIERAIWGYPGDFPAARGALRVLAENDPAHFASLLEFALKKHEEYQLAVPAK